MDKKILVVDDEALIVKGIKFSLEQEGYKVTCAYDGEEGLALFSENEFDMVLLDLMMPGIDGMQVCQRIREVSNVPIIMLTAKGEDMDKILGFENGADDYITKPFNILEVKARMKAIFRRNTQIKEEMEQSSKKSASDHEIINAKGLVIDVDGRKVTVNNKAINLTVKEFDLLLLFVKNPGKVYGRENLLNIVWGYEYPGDVRTVDVHVRRLREKIEDNPSDPVYVHTKWGVGYYFE